MKLKSNFRPIDPIKVYNFHLMHFYMFQKFKKSK
jgi:hypothetical protein